MPSLRVAAETVAARPLRRAEGPGHLSAAALPGLRQRGDDRRPRSELYEEGTYAPVPPRARGLVILLTRIFERERVGVLKPVAARGATVLDVGAGRGGFVAAARRAGYEASGIELSEQGSRVAATRGAPVRWQTLESTDIAPGSLDAVTMWHVLEHLDDPAGALERAASWLAPAGCLVIAVPNLASLQARIGGARWFHLDVPRHRSHFTPAGLDELLRRAGLRRVRTRHALIEHNLYGMWQTWLNRLTRRPSYFYNVLRRNVSLRTSDLPLSLAGLVLVPLAVTAELLAGVAGHGGTVVVVARRSDALPERPPPRIIKL